jgi:cytochrome P450
MIELARDPDLQARVRAELHHAFPGSADADYDTLSDPSNLPLLDAVVHEVLRVYPPLLEALRTVRLDAHMSIFTLTP